jgi:hypothetical protein
VLCFIEETREYFTGKLRKGETMGGQEVADLIRTFKKYLPGCVKEVILLPPINNGPTHRRK